MADEIKPKTNSENEKLQYLKRNEVRTMDKDVSVLREVEAKEERQKIAKIRAEEGKKQTIEKENKAVLEAEKRTESSEQARAKEEEIPKIKEKIEELKKEDLTKTQQSTEEKKEALKEALEQTAKREEEERQRFLERVEAKAENKEQPAPLMPQPSFKAPKPNNQPMPPVPGQEIVKPITPKIEKPAEIKPLIDPQNLKSKPPVKKIAMRILFSFLALAILGAIIYFAYWYFAVREEPSQEPPLEQEIENQPELNQEEELTEEIEPIESGEEIQPLATPDIINSILGFGYHIPAPSRTIDTIIIHTIYNALGGDIYSLEGILDEYEMYGVAAHYLIDRNGTIYKTAPEEAIAYHAGQSQMPDGRTNVNNFSIGIELINSEEENPSQAQYQSLAFLVNDIKERYGISPTNILGHKDIAPDRKTDPWNFDWVYFNSLLQ
jgi:hypothetical protein